MTDTAQLEKLPGLVKELTGRPVDVLINNAGIPGGGEFVDPLARADRCASCA